MKNFFCYGWSRSVETGCKLCHHTVKNAVELFFAFHPDVEKIQYH